jgi:Protein of unknown function (DUF1549)/Protein of unknown function (DUF1553)
MLQNARTQWQSSAEAAIISTSIDGIGLLGPKGVFVMRGGWQLSLLFALAASLVRLCAADGLLPPEKPVEEAIDYYLDARLTKDGVTAAAQAGDANLLRRTMLDLVGRIPTAVEAKGYVASPDTNKRVALVDRLMASPAFVRQQAAELDALLMRGTDQNLKEYLAASLEKNVPWDQMFREMIIGQEGDAEQKGAIKFIRSRAKDTDKLTADAGVLFFGVNVSCAKCHDHPLVPTWTQEHYFGMKSFFSRTYDVGEFIGEKEYGIVNYKTVQGEAKDARLMFLTGEVLTEPESKEPDENAKKEEKKKLEELKKSKQAPPAVAYSRRARLVEVGLKDGTQPYFARAIVNQLWHRLMGRGLVMPLDQMHDNNQSSHPELLAWLARDMQTHKYDLRRLIRGIVLSKAYSRTSEWDGSKERPAEDLFAIAMVRPLTPWQYGTSLRVAAASPDFFSADLKEDELDNRMKQMEGAGGNIAGSLEYPEDDFQVSVDEALLFSNSDKIKNELLRDGNEMLCTKLAGIKVRREAMEAAIWNIYSRPPADEELTALEQFLHKHEDQPALAWKQAVWAMLTSGECRFNF